jgi:hypothetical protein
MKEKYNGGGEGGGGGRGEGGRYTVEKLNRKGYSKNCSYI